MGPFPMSKLARPSVLQRLHCQQQSGHFALGFPLARTNFKHQMEEIAQGFQELSLYMYIYIYTLAEREIRSLRKGVPLSKLYGWFIWMESWNLAMGTQYCLSHYCNNTHNPTIQLHEWPCWQLGFMLRS